MQQIGFVGLKDVIRDLRKAEGNLPRQIRLLLNEIGEEILVPEIRSRMSGLIKRDAGHGLLRSVRAISTQTSGRVQVGYPRSVEHAGWWEFGGDTHSPRGGVVRERVPGGRTVYPTWSAKSGDVRRAMEGVVNQIASMIDGQSGNG